MSPSFSSSPQGWAELSPARLFVPVLGRIPGGSLPSAKQTPCLAEQCKVFLAMFQLHGSREEPAWRSSCHCSGLELSYQSSSSLGPWQPSPASFDLTMNLGAFLWFSFFLFPFFFWTLKKSSPPTAPSPLQAFYFTESLYIFQPKMDVGESSPQKPPQLQMELGQF